jgi:teichuronic acid exporter
LPLILGERWRPAVLPLQLLCPVGALMLIGAALAPLLIAVGRPDCNLRYNAACSVLFPAGFSAGAWWFAHDAAAETGLIGVCLAWVLLYPIMVTALIHLTRHITGVTPAAVFRSHGPVLMGLAVMTMMVLAVQHALVNAGAGMRLVAAISSGALTYAVWMLVTARGSVLADFAVVARELRSRRVEAQACE